MSIYGWKCLWEIHSAQLDIIKNNVEDKHGSYVTVILSTALAAHCGAL